MGHRDDLLVTRQYTRMTNPAGGPPTRSVCLLGFVQVLIGEVAQHLGNGPAGRPSGKPADIAPKRSPESRCRLAKCAEYAGLIACRLIWPVAALSIVPQATI